MFSAHPVSLFAGGGLVVMRIAVTSGLLAALIVGPQSRVEAQKGAALTGEVSSKNEGKMEGVAVRAQREGANFRVSIYSDTEGRYSFPRSRMAPGRYTLTIRAAGYDLVPPRPVEILADKTATANLTLRPTTDLTRQLMTLMTLGARLRLPQEVSW